MDLYQILEIPQKTATEAQIRRAYRRLARQWHPDVNPSPEAAAHFQEIKNAFETLRDVDKRREYDKNLGLGQAYTEAYAMLDSNLHTTMAVDLSQAVFGDIQTIVSFPLLACIQCQGFGVLAGHDSERCELCRGKGEYYKTAQAKAGRAFTTKLTTCPACLGKGLCAASACKACCALGFTRQRQVLEINIPPGSIEGTVLRVEGAGNAGVPTRRVSTGRERRGDLFIKLEIRENDSRFQRVGSDVYTELTVPIVFAVLGGMATVPTVNGGFEEVMVPAGTQHGDILSVSNEKLPGKGVHYVTVRLSVPTKVSLGERQVLEQLAKLRVGNPVKTQ